MKLWKSSLVISIFIFSASVNSAVIEYDESINGDLGDYIFNVQSLGSLDIGTNTIIGTNSGNLEEIILADWDMFLFTVESGNQVDSLFIDYESTPGIGKTIFLQQITDTDSFGNNKIVDIFDFYLGPEPTDFIFENIISSQTDMLSYLILAPCLREPID